MFAKIMIDLKLYWYSEWLILGEQCDVHWDVVEPDVWKANITKVLNFVEKNYLTECILKARNTNSHGLYNELLFMNGGGFLRLNFSDQTKCLLIKARLGFLNLNNVPWRNEESQICSICNLGSVENIEHFIGVCPAFASSRSYYFGKNILDKSDIITILNGEDWLKLCSFLQNSMSYRRFLINQFNY